MYSEPRQKSKMKSFFSFQKLVQISGNCIKYRKERIKASVAIEILKQKIIAKPFKLLMKLMAHGIPKTMTEDPKEDAITEDSWEEPKDGHKEDSIAKDSKADSR